MTLEEIEQANLPVMAMTSRDRRLVSYDGSEYNYLYVTELYEDDTWVQRAIADDDRIIHVVDTFVVESSATLAYKELYSREGCFALTLRLKEVIENELSRRKREKVSFKRWLAKVQSVPRQLFLYDFDWLDYALDDPDLFINENILALP